MPVLFPFSGLEEFSDTKFLVFIGIYMPVFLLMVYVEDQRNFMRMPSLDESFRSGKS